MRRRGVNERDERSFGARPGLFVDEAHALRFQMIERGTNVLDAKSDVVQAGPALVDVFRDRRIGRRGLEQLERRLTRRNEVRAHTLRRDVFGHLDVQAERIAIKRERG